MLFSMSEGRRQVSCARAKKEPGHKRNRNKRDAGEAFSVASGMRMSGFAWRINNANFLRRPKSLPGIVRVGRKDVFLGGNSMGASMRLSRFE